MNEPEATNLLRGPRGRRLCFEVQQTGGATGTGALMRALAESVSLARYWQEPDEQDQHLAASTAQDELAPVAAAVVAAPAAAWWWTPAALGDQQVVTWVDPGHDYSTSLTGAAAKLAAWREQTVEHERRDADRPTDPRAPWSGDWWSTPAMSGLPATTRAAAGLGAVALALTEDDLGWHEARVGPVRVRPGVRVWEIASPDGWAELVRRYPLEVSLSRRHDWFRATGRAGRWLIPDYAAVAADWDAVHLTVAGYLGTAGVAWPLDREADTATVLAGWDPDQTWWLADVLTSDGPETYWVNPDGGGPGWRADSTQSPQ